MLKTLQNGNFQSTPQLNHYIGLSGFFDFTMKNQCLYFRRLPLSMVYI